MNGSLTSILEQSASIVVALPQNPNLDSVAAGLSLYLALKDKKQVSIYCPSPMVVEFNRLVGVDRIKQEIGNRNLIIRFKSYQATDIEKVSYDIEDGEFKLTVVPKENVLPPNQDQLDVSHAGVRADTTIIVGGASVADFPIVESELKDSQVLHVGNKAIAGSGVIQIISLARSASSISESVWKVLAESQITLDADTASNLLFGIEEETANFASSSTNADTFQAMAELLRVGGRRRPIIEATTHMAGIPQRPLPPFLMQKKQELAKKLDALKPLTQLESEPAGVEEGAPDKPPTEWFGPKIFKGTNVS